MILAAVVLMVDVYFQIVTVIVGLLLVEAGIWKLTQPLLPNERKYTALRREVDGFLGLVRRLNSSALEMKRGPAPDAQREYEAVQSEMHAMVNRLALYAGKTEDELEAEQT